LPPARGFAKIALTMQLFLVASLPLLFSLVIMLPWGRSGVPSRLTLVITLLKGILLFFPGYLVVALLRRIVGFSYDGFLLYLSLFLGDHAVPLLAGLGAFLLLQRTLAFSGTDEGIFLTVFSFLCGFMAMIDLTDLVRAWNTWTSYDLFLLPVLRLSGVVLVSLAAPRWFRWEGRDALKFAAVVAGLAGLLAVVSFLDRRSLPWWAGAVAFAAVAAVISFFALRFPRALRG
jgi:hypothetical protein